jgi:uncharacterized protein GlcG (DUF336 family)
VFALALILAGPAFAQQPAAPVPDQMPFDIPYGPSITVEKARQVVAAAVAITVVDPSGELVYFYKMDQTQIASIAISQGKARTAARFRRPSGAFFNIANTPNGSWVGTLDPTLVASHGGFPLVEGGKIIGAVGCSGATGDQDGVACKAAADTIK